jgi:putative oxidoreductase
MSATSPTTSTGVRSPGDTDDVVATARAHATVPRRSALHSLVETTAGVPATVTRLTLGLVMFPHAAQKVLGWFGGYGLMGTYEALTTQLGLAPVIAWAVIWIEFLSSVLLILGLFTRLAAFGIMAIMLGAIALVHLPYGFFMNWGGVKFGEGFEYHLLALGLATATAIMGGGRYSIDRVLMKRRPAEGGSVGEPVTCA